MSAIPVNEVLLQELNQLIGSKMLTLEFLKKICFVVPIPRNGENARSSPLRTPRKLAHGISLKNKLSLKKFQVIWQP